MLNGIINLREKNNKQEDVFKLASTIDKFGRHTPGKEGSQKYNIIIYILENGYKPEETYGYEILKNSEKNIKKFLHRMSKRICKIEGELNLMKEYLYDIDIATIKTIYSFVYDLDNLKKTYEIIQNF